MVFYSVTVLFIFPNPWIFIRECLIRILDSVIKNIRSGPFPPIELICLFIARWSRKPVFRIRIWIRPDPKLFGLQDPDLDSKLLILDPDPATDPDPSPFSHQTYKYVLKMHWKVNKLIIISNTILEKFKMLKISTHLCLIIDQNWKLFSPSLVHRRICIQDPDPKFLIFNLWIGIGIRIRNDWFWIRNTVGSQNCMYLDLDPRSHM